LGRPKYTVTSPDPYYQEKKENVDIDEKELKKVKERLGLQYMDLDNGVLLFEDEAKLELKPTMCANWQKQKEQKKIPTPGKNQWLSAFGAVNYLTGKLTSIVQNRKRSEEFWDLLDAVLDDYPDKEIIMVLDNATPHHSKKTYQHLLSKKYKRLHLVFLPTYSPWLNPIERFWKYMLRQITHNYLFKSLLELKNTARNFFSRFTQPNQTILSIIKHTIN